MDRDPVDIVIRVVLAFVMLGSAMVGLILAVVALFGMAKHGSKGILAKAVAALFIILVWVLFNLFAAST